MTNRLQRGANRLTSRMAAKAASTVVYSRDGEADQNASAVIGEFHFETTDTNGFLVHTHSRDFLILASALAGTGEPQAQDEIRETDEDGVTRLYRVMAPAGEPVWRWSDEFNRKYRIHTKFIKEV